VFVYAPDQPPLSFAMAAAHAVDAAQGVVRIAVDLSLVPAVVRGVVQSCQQEPLPATVSCWHHELRAFSRLTADQNGAFRFDRIPPGTVDLYFDHPGQAGASKREVTVAAGGDVDLGIVQLGAASAVSGTVTGPDGQPPAHVVISILTADKQLTAEYASGTYRLTGVPPGKHVLHVQGAGLAAMRIPLDVAPGAEAQQDIALQAGIARKFRIDFPAGTCTWVTLMLGMPDESHTWLLGQPVRGAAKAEFVAFMAPGTYEASAWSENKLQGRTTVVFAQGEESEVRIELRKQ